MITKQKNSKLEESMLTDTGELFDNTRGLAKTGLQQYFTPAPLAKFICEVLEERWSSSVLDLTAGNGALLAPWRERGHNTYGLEIDKTQASEAPSELGVSRADVRLAVPYMKALKLRFDKVLLNPPFGITWEQDGKSINSAVQVARFLESVLARRGEGCFICDARQWESCKKAINSCFVYTNLQTWAEFKIAGVFRPESEVEIVLAFFSDYDHNEDPLTWDGLDFADFKTWAPDVEFALKEKREDWWRSAVHLNTKRVSADFEACASAARAEAAGRAQKYALQLHGSQLKVKLSDFQSIQLARTWGEEWLETVRKWSGLSLKYFALNTIEAEAILSAIDSEMITAEPDGERPGVVTALKQAIAEAPKYVAPFFPLKPTQKLGFLERLNEIKCIESDKENGFRAGESYPLAVAVQEWKGRDFKKVNRTQNGELTEQVREVQTSGKYLKIVINGVAFDEDPKSIEYITTHFEIPDPGCVASYYPEAYKRYKAELKKLERPGFHFRPFQIDDLARLAIRPGGVLSWEQGLGKMIGGLAWTLIRRCSRVLFIAPQDLIPQWQREAKEKFGLTLTRIKNVKHARQIAKTRRPAPGAPPEFYIVHFEALARREKSLERFELDENNEPAFLRWPVGVSQTRGNNGEPKREVIFEDFTSACPHCRQSFAWDGEHCNPRVKKEIKGEIRRGCGFVNISRRTFPMAHYLKRAFSGIVIDEGTKIKSDDSLISLAVRSLRARARLVLTGTPIKNFLPDAFWLILWANGMKSSRAFPYSFKAKGKFLADYCVIERELPGLHNGNRWGERRVRPEISNLNMLYKLLGANILRRRKSETGEDLVSKRLIPVRCPFGESQQELYAWWLFNFGRWYAERPDTSIRDSRYADALAALLGQLWKLRQVCTIPGHTGLAEHNGQAGESHRIPKMLTCLRLIREGLEAREPVVVFNTMRDASLAIRDELARGGVRTHIIDGQVAPVRRSEIIQDFKAGEFQVLLCGLEAVNLGHNLENARRAIVYSLPFDLAGFDQAINRVHRLTSKESVMCHVLLTSGASGSIDEKLWDLVSRKGKYAGLALDGRLGFDEVEEVNWSQVAKDLRENFARGSAIPDEEIEDKIERFWDDFHLIESKDGKRQGGAAAGVLDGGGAFTDTDWTL